MARTARQTKILELIQEKDITSQEELIAELKKCGVTVNQSTVSRDIRELGVTKVVTTGGKSKYVYAEAGGAESRQVSGKFISMYREAVLSVESSENLIVVKTLSGSASAAALAIEKMNVPGILGSIAGDDTLLLIAKTREDVVHIKKALLSFLD